MGLRLRTTPSGTGTVLPGGVLGRYGGRSRGPFASFAGSAAVAAPNPITGGGGYQDPGPHVEAYARSVMGRAVGSIVAATPDGARLIVRGVDGVWYITDHQGVPLQATTVQLATQLVQAGQFVQWRGTVMPDGNIQWANMSPGDAAAMASAMGAPDAAAAAAAPTATAPASAAPAAAAASGLGGAGVPAGMRFVGIGQDGRTLVFTDASGVTHAFTRDPATMQLTPVASAPRTAPPTTAPPTTAPPTTAPPTTAAPPQSEPVGPVGPVGPTEAPAPTPAPPMGMTTPALIPPPPSADTTPTTPAPEGTVGPVGPVGPTAPAPVGPVGPVGPMGPVGPTPTVPPQSLYDVLQASPDQYQLSPQQIAELQNTPIDPSMFDPGFVEPTPPPPNGGSGGTNLQ